MATFMWRYKKYVFPIVEFEQGIPLDLENDSYFDPKVRIMIMLNDLMSTASKDPKNKRCVHRRKPSQKPFSAVLNQNLYFFFFFLLSAEPFEHHRTVWKRPYPGTKLSIIHDSFQNPIDKLQVMTLPRQMYPRNSN